MHRLLGDVRAFDAAGYWADEGAASCASWLSWRVGWSPGTGREHVRVARALAGLPCIDAALAAGRLSYSKVRALTRIATPATEEALLTDALATTAAQLERICRKVEAVRRQSVLSVDEDRARRSVTRRELPDGMVAIEVVLPADEAALVMAAIDREAMAIRSPGTSPPDLPAETPPASPHPSSDRADGLVAMCQAVLRGRAPQRAPIEVVLTVPRATLATSPREREAAAAPSEIAHLGDGTAVGTVTAERLACDAGVVELTVDDHGQPRSIGRRTRTIPAAVARALAQRDPTCRFPGCTARRYLDGHHLVHWARGGATTLSNLVRLCGRHHRFVHEHGYQVSYDHGALAFFDPRGRRVDHEPPRRVTTPLGWPSLRARAAADQVAITPVTGQCGWDGWPVQYRLVVDELVRLGLRGPG